MRSRSNRSNHASGQRTRTLFAAFAAALALAAAPGALAADLAFSDQTVAAGVEMSPVFPVNRFSGGAAIADFDNDGWQDVLFAMGGLYLNEGDGTFSPCCPTLRGSNGSAAAAGDIDADGHIDAVIVSDLSALILRNEGDGALVGHQSVNLGADGEEGLGAAFGDFDIDGDLDLMIAVRSINPTRVPPVACVLLENDGAGNFTDITQGVGLFDGVESFIVDLVAGFAPRFVDMNGDRAPELLLAADFGSSQYWTNDGAGGLTNVTPPTCHSSTPARR